MEGKRRCLVAVKIGPKSSSKGSSSSRIHLILKQMRKRRRRATRSLTNYLARMTRLKKIKPKTKKIHLLLSRHLPKLQVTSKPWLTRRRVEAILPMTTHLLKVAQRRVPVLTQLPNSLKRKTLLQASSKRKKLTKNSKIMRARSRRARMSRTFQIQTLAAMAMIRNRRLQSSLLPLGSLPWRGTKTRTKKRLTSSKPSWLIYRVSSSSPIMSSSNGY